MSTREMWADEMMDKVEELRAEVTVLKAERDEAKNDFSNLQQTLLNLLARIHRDGGQFVDEHGFEKAIEAADDLIVAEHVTADKLRFAKAAIVKLADMATCYLTCEVDPTEDLVAEIEALRNVGEMP